MTKTVLRVLVLAATLLFPVLAAGTGEAITVYKDAT